MRQKGRRTAKSLSFILCNLVRSNLTRLDYLYLARLGLKRAKGIEKKFAYFLYLYDSIKKELLLA
jgi:hypothetical protein